ncbi:MAG: thiamine pyrophosphate-dependent enzyme [Myxococcota bacterium]|nr:thiamine pyrophosphate-dependent enzyme [Myxococcota bacterium]
MSMRQALSQVRDAGQALAETGALATPVQGLEAVIVGGFSGMSSKDWIVPGLRERAGAVLRGCSVERLQAPHAGARPYRIAPVSADPAARMLHACGLAMAMRDQDLSVLCFVGQGSASYGAFHEAMNMAVLHRLPVVFLAHHWDLDDPESPLSPQVAGSMQGLALAHGLRPHSVDGGLVTEVLSAVAEARAHSGPSFIEARLLRGEDPLRRAYDELTENEPAASNQLS